MTMRSSSQASARAKRKKTLCSIQPVRPRTRKPPSFHLTKADWDAIARLLDLSDRQLEIVRHLIDGHNENAIGKRLGISSHTVHAHMNRLYKKIKVRSRGDLVVRVMVAYIARSASKKRAKARAGA